MWRTLRAGETTKDIIFECFVQLEIYIGWYTPTRFYWDASQCWCWSYYVIRHVLRSGMAGLEQNSEYSFSRDIVKRKKRDGSCLDLVGLAPPPLESGDVDLLMMGTLGGPANTDEDLVNVLLSAPSLKTAMNDDFHSDDGELSRCMSVPWVLDDEVLLPCLDDMQKTEVAIIKRDRSTGNFVLISEDPNDMKTPFVGQQDAAVADRKGDMTWSPSSDESSDDCFSGEHLDMAMEYSKKQFKLACLAGYLKSLMATTNSSRHVASGVPCITPRSIEECLVPRRYAADDLAQCFFDVARITGSP